MHIDLNADLGEGFGSWRMGDDEAMMNKRAHPNRQPVGPIIDLFDISSKPRS